MEIQIQKIEEENKEIVKSSNGFPTGRINVAHGRKKHRIDAELERLLDMLEQKRDTIAEMEESINELNCQKDVREKEMIGIFLHAVLQNKNFIH